MNTKRKAPNPRDLAVRNMKATLFAHVFSKEEALVDLYSALGKHISVEDIEYLDLDILLQRPGRYNDTAFLTKDNRLIVFVEYQSTLNQNMPFRFLEYFVFTVKQLFSAELKNRFGTKFIELPKVEFYVAYNGKGDLKESTRNLLLDLGDIFVKVTVADVRYDILPETSHKNSLAGYSYFVKMFEDRKSEGHSPYEAFKFAVDECLKEGYLTDILTSEESVDVFMEYYSYDDQLIAEGRAEGEAEGKAKGKAEGAIKLMELIKAGLTPEAALQEILTESEKKLVEV